MRKTKIPKKYWEKGKSKFLEFRPELREVLCPRAEPPNGRFEDMYEDEDIRANRERRARLKINQIKHPESYYSDTDVYTNPENNFYKGDK